MVYLVQERNNTNCCFLKLLGFIHMHIREGLLGENLGLQPPLHCVRKRKPDNAKLGTMLVGHLALVWCQVHCLNFNMNKPFEAATVAASFITEI